MAETTYFERSNLNVTDSHVMAENYVYRTEEIRSVSWYPGIACWVWLALMVIAPSIILFRWADYIVLPFGLQYLIATVVLVLWAFVVKPTYRVKMKGAFGKVEFDCGTDLRCSSQLLRALRRFTGQPASKMERALGVA